MLNNRLKPRYGCFAWSPDGGTLATAFGNQVELWDGATGGFQRRANVHDVSSLAWLIGGHTLAVGSGGNTRLVDASTGQESFPGMMPEVSQDSMWSPDGRVLASPLVDAQPTPIGSAPPPNPTPADGLIRLSDTSTGNTIRVIRIPNQANGGWVSVGWVTKLGWSPDGRYLAALSKDKNIRVWNLGTGELKQTFAAPAERAGPFDEISRDFAWSPSGSTLAVIAGRVVELWDIDAGKKLRALPDPAPPPPELPTPVPTKESSIKQPTAPPPPVPTNAQGFTVTPWPTLPPGPSLTPTPTYVYRGEGYVELAGMAWSPDRRALATFDGDHISVWDVDSGRQKARFTAGGQVQKVAWSPDSSVLASLDGPHANGPVFSMIAGADPYNTFLEGAIRLWDPDTGKELLSILKGSASDFYWSPDGKSLAARVGTTAVLWGVSSSGHWSLLTGGSSGSPTHQATTNAPLVVAASPTARPICGSWSMVDSPDAGAVTNELQAVAVAANKETNTVEAWAVGHSSDSLVSPYNSNSYTGNGSRTLVQHWNGTAWSIVPSPNVGADENILNGVAALSASDVWAVGYYGVGPSSKTLTIHWNGTAWSIMGSPDVGTGGNELHAMAAIAANDVWAVGRSGVCGNSEQSCLTRALTLHWDGRRWSNVQSPNVEKENNSLSAVSAASTSDVWAVGYHQDLSDPEHYYQTRLTFLHWDGKAWSRAQGPSLAVYSLNVQGLVAISPNNAWAVGSYSGGDPESETLIFHWDGKTWTHFLGPTLTVTRALAPGPVETRRAELVSVAALSTDNVWAVGNYEGAYEGEEALALAMRWDGKSWSIVPTPSTGHATLSYLTGVASVSKDDAWAVGYSVSDPNSNSRKTQMLFMHWNGKVWSIVPGPSLNSVRNELYSIAVVSRDDVWAVGEYDTGLYQWKALITHWDGKTWSVVAPDPAIKPGPPPSGLYRVAAISRDNVWAVGSEESRTLVLHWDGKSWSRLPGVAPSPGSVYNHLSGIAAFSDKDIWVTGSYSNQGGGPLQALLLHWDGTAWSDIPGLNLATNTSLDAIAAVSPNDLWVAGGLSGQGTSRLFLGRYTGTGPPCPTP